MNQIAGSITFKGTIDTSDFSFVFVVSDIKEGVHNIFLHGETTLGSSQEVIDYVKGKIKGEIVNYDVSISTEDKIRLSLFKEGKYERRDIQGLDATFEGTIQEMESKHIVAIREAEESKIFGNRIIKIDYMI